MPDITVIKKKYGIAFIKSDDDSVNKENLRYVKRALTTTIKEALSEFELTEHAHQRYDSEKDKTVTEIKEEVRFRATPARFKVVERYDWERDETRVEVIVKVGVAVICKDSATPGLIEERRKEFHKKLGFEELFPLNRQVQFPTIGPIRASELKDE